MKSQRLLGLPGITAVCLLLIFVSLTPSPLAARDSRSSIKDFEHVFHHDGEHGLRHPDW